MGKRENQGVGKRLRRIFSGSKPKDDPFADRKPTGTEIKVIDFLGRYAAPITTALLEMRDAGFAIQGPRLGYHDLKGSGTDLYTGAYALAVPNDEMSGLKAGANKFFCYEWEIFGLGYLYLLPVLDDESRLIGVDYVARGIEFVRGGNILFRQETANPEGAIEQLRKALDLWRRNADKWKTGGRIFTLGDDA